MLTRTGSDHGRVLGAVSLLAACLLYVGVSLFLQLSFIADPSYFHEEQRSLFRYYPIQDPALFAGDYLASVVGAYPQPYLYEGITRLWLWAGGDLIALHRLLPIVCWLAFLAGVALAARRLGDRVTMAAAVCLAVAQPLFLHQISPATPHAFAFPLLIWGIAALLYGSLGGLTVVTLLSGLLYTAVTPLLGLLLAWQVLVMQDLRHQTQAVRLKALSLLAVTGALSLWLVFGSLSPPEQFGASLAPMQQMGVYPENGPEGRHFSGVFNPLLYVLSKAVAQFQTPQLLQAAAILFVCIAVAVYGLTALPKDRALRKAVLGFVLCSVTVGVVVYLLRPYHSYRYILYPAFTILPLFFVVGLQQVCRRLERLLRYPDAVTLAVLLPLVLAFDSYNPEKAGYRWHLTPGGQAVIDFAAAQPPDRLFAVWPSALNELELIPYLAARPLFVMRKAHYPNFEGHLLTMRARMEALTEAYLATDEAPLRALHCRWGVDYLVAEKAHFAPQGERPTYFAPFDARIGRLWQTHSREDFLLASPDLAAVALDSGGYRVVDLAALSGGSCAPPPGAAEAD